MFRYALCAPTLEQPTTKQAMDVTVRAGYDGIELWAEPLKAECVSPAHVRRLGADNGLELRLHASIRDLNIASSNAGIRKESVRQILQDIRLAAKLDVKAVTLHGGRRTSSRVTVEASWDRLEESLRIIGQLAGQLGVVVGIENLELKKKELVCDWPAQERAMLAAGVGVTLDLAHYTTVGDPADLVARAHSIVNVHLSEATPSQVHLPFGEGSIDLRPAIQLLARKYPGGTLVAECDYKADRARAATISLVNLKRLVAEALDPVPATRSISS